MFSLSMRRRPRPHRKLEYWGIVFTLTLSLAVAATCCRTRRSCRDGSLHAAMLGLVLLPVTRLTLLAAKEIDRSRRGMKRAGLVTTLTPAFR